MPTGQVLQTPITLEKLEATVSDKWLFVGIDLAPHDMLESGISVIDRDRKLLRLDKLYALDGIETFLMSLGGPSSLIVAIDMPKNLNLESKWRQDEIRMHPLRLSHADLIQMGGNPSEDRFAERLQTLVDTLSDEGVLVVTSLSYQLKNHYGLFNPYRNRSPQGCKLLQASLGKILGVQDVPKSLLPSSVLDSIVMSYAAWTMYAGTEGENYSLTQNNRGRVYLNPGEPVEVVQASGRRRRYRYNPFHRSNRSS